MVSNARKQDPRAASPYRSLMAWRNISPISSDSVMSIVVWLAQPMRSRSRSGSKPGDMAPCESAQERGRVTVVTDVVADDGGLGTVEDDEVTALRVLERLRGSGACLLVFHFPMNDGREPVLGVPHDVLPDVQDRSARGVDERAALARQARHLADGHAKGRKNHHVVFPETVGAFAGVGQEANALAPQPIVDVRVVDDFAGQEDVSSGEAPPRLVGVVDRAVHAIAKAELASEVDDQPAAGVLEIARADTIDERAVVRRRELTRDGFLHVEALAENQGLGSAHRAYLGRSPARGVNASSARSSGTPARESDASSSERNASSRVALDRLETKVRSQRSDGRASH